MTPRRGTAVAIALLLTALATAGCGLGPGEDRGDVELTVSRDYGAESLLSLSVGDVTESDTVMRVLDRNAEITTRYGGGFVQSIDGLEADRGLGDSFDWFFYVNGVESTVGAADYPLRGGERIWWDYRDWSEAMRVPAVVGSWPQPFTGGYAGKRHPVAVECMGGGDVCAKVRERLEGVGASTAGGSPTGAIRILVGPWAKVREDPAAALIEDGSQISGVFADFRSVATFPRYARKSRNGRFELWGLSQAGSPTRRFGPDAGLVAATRRYDAPPVWVVTGATAAAVRAAADLLDAADLRDHYAVATEGGEETPLPLGI